MLSRDSSSSVKVSDESSDLPVNFLLKAKLTGAATTANNLYYVVTDPAKGSGIASIAADLSLLKSQAINIYHKRVYHNRIDELCSCEILGLNLMVKLKNLHFD
jgi:hypothetical protein